MTETYNIPAPILPPRAVFDRLARIDIRENDGYAQGEEPARSSADLETIRRFARQTREALTSL